MRDAFLCKKAVGVLGNQGACVIAKSYEMKAAGVGTGMEPSVDITELYAAPPVPLNLTP